MVAPFQEVNWLKCQVDHLPPSTDKVKNARSFSSTPCIHLHDVLLRCKVNFACTLSAVAVNTTFTTESQLPFDCVTEHL
jgi:hypothetical protein